MLSLTNTHKPKVISYINLPEPILHQIAEHCDLVSFDLLQDETTKDSFYEELKESVGLIGADLLIDEELLNKAPKLKVVSNISVGYDNFDLPLMTKHGVMGTNTPGVSETTADLVMALVLAAARRIPELDQYVKNKQWKDVIDLEHYGLDVHKRTLGIIGMGEIGTAVAKRAHFGFDMDIIYHNRNRHEEREQVVNAVYCELDELLRKSDFVLMMAPGNENTRHMIGEEEFKLMQANAIFINASRGQNVDEAALVNALKQGHIHGAALDVYETEPISPDHELLQLDNAITVPHIGSATFETRLKMVQMAITNLIHGVSNDIPPNLINKEVLEAK